MRCVVLVLLALAACAPEPSGLTPEEAYAAAERAIREHDAETAHALLAEAAAQDHLPSLLRLMQGYERGLVVPGEFDGTLPVTLPLDRWPGQSLVTGFRAVRATSRGVRAGDPVARSHHAIQLALDGDPAHRAQAERIYRDLRDAAAPPYEVIQLAALLGHDADRERLTRQSAAGGHPRGCADLLFFVEPSDRSTTAGLAAHLDRALACSPDGPAADHARQSVETLGAERARGNAAAAVALDSLRLLGVFERHPGLEQTLATLPRS